MGSNVSQGICWGAQARQHVLEDLNKSGKAARVKGFERIAAVHLDSEEWSVDNDMVGAHPYLKSNTNSE